MVSPSKKFCVYLVFRPIESELHVGVSFCLLREPAFYQPVFKSSLKVVGEYIFCVGWVVLAAVTSVFLGMRGRNLVLCCIMRKAVLLLCNGRKG